MLVFQLDHVPNLLLSNFHMRHKWSSACVANLEIIPSTLCPHVHLCVCAFGGGFRSVYSECKYLIKNKSLLMGRRNILSIARSPFAASARNERAKWLTSPGCESTDPKIGEQTTCIPDAFSISTRALSVWIFPYPRIHFRLSLLCILLVEKERDREFGVGRARYWSAGVGRRTAS